MLRQPRHQACNIAAHQHGDATLLVYFATQGISIDMFLLRIAAENKYIDCLAIVHHALQQKNIAFPYEECWISTRIVYKSWWSTVSYAYPVLFGKG